MKQKILLILLFVSLVHNTFAQNNYIIAGYHDSTMIYHDIIPDHVIMQDTNSIYYIDVDQNNNPDFSIHSIYATGLGVYESSFSIYPLNNNRSALGHVVNVPGWQGVWSRNVAKINNYGDTIGSNLNYVGGHNYMKSSFDSQGYSFNIQDWTNIGEKYLGIKWVLTDTIAYGWIRVEVYSDSMIVKDFAVNYPNPLLFKKNNYKDEVLIYPNPAKEFAKVEFNNIINDSFYEIINNVGFIVKQGIISGKSGNININNIPSGIYILRIFYKNSYVIKKIIIN